MYILFFSKYDFLINFGLHVKFKLSTVGILRFLTIFFKM